MVMSFANKDYYKHPMNEGLLEKEQTEREQLKPSDMMMKRTAGTNRSCSGQTIIGFMYGCALSLLITVIAKCEFLSEPESVHTAVGHRVFTWPDPPPHAEVAKVARYVMHISDWGSLSTVSTHQKIESYPFVNVFSVSDGPVGNSSGIPYFYFTQLELSVKDLAEDTRVSFTVSEDQSDYCIVKGFDPEDPRCAHIIFTGRIVKVEKGSNEEDFARRALFSRHEEMPGWPKDHNWFFAKMDIIHIYVLDYFGGASTVDVKQYYESNPF